MRYAILGDIHANVAAFEAVLRDADARSGFDKIWCLGDMVGYGPDPHECIELLRQYEHVCIAGNLDWAAIGRMNTSDFNPAAAQACRWTREQLTRQDKDYLQNLPLTLCHGDFTLVHGSPREPIWEYLLSVEAAQANFAYFQTGICLVGHDVAVYEAFGDGASLTLGGDRLIINPGGVGQPRDGDPRASYAIYDDEANAVYHYRVEYDIASTQKKMEERGLPLPLILRLSEGW